MPHYDSSDHNIRLVAVAAFAATVDFELSIVLL